MLGVANFSVAVFVWESPGGWVWAHFQQEAGWVTAAWDNSAAYEPSRVICEILAEAALAFRRQPLHMRVFLDVLDANVVLPSSIPQWHQCSIVAEVSSMPDSAVGEFWKAEVRAACDSHVA